MNKSLSSRRRFLSAAGVVAATGVAGLHVPATAQDFKATRTMRGGSNNYHAGAPIVDRIGGGGFWMSGTVRRAGDGKLLAGQRIQIWAHTTEGHERDLHSHGATLTDENGEFRLEMPQIVPAFGRHMVIWRTTAITLKPFSCARLWQVPKIPVSAHTLFSSQSELVVFVLASGDVIE